MEINNYYQLLGLKYKFSPFKLLLNYLQRTKTSLNSNTPDNFIKVRQGFEVLRQEEATESYNRIFKKHILKQNLSYPKQKEQEMIRTFQEKEENGKMIAENVIKRKESYFIHLSKIILELLVVDLSRIIAWGASGLLFIGIGLWAMFMFHNEDNFIGGGTAILIGLFFLRRNVKYYIIG